MSAVAEQVHVTLSGDIEGEYLVEDRRPDGRLSLAPARPANEPGFSGRKMSPEEWQAFLDEHGPYMQPPDGEG